MHTKRKLEALEKRESDLLYKMRIKDLKDTKKAMENKFMLETMEADAKRWPTMLDMN